nr:immunoglobulin light chain junction region [Macaca mulatta]
CQQYNDMLYSF